MTLTQRIAAYTSLIFTAMMTSCGPTTFVVGLSPGDQRLVTTMVEDDPKVWQDRVAIVEVSGMIVNADRQGILRTGENPVSELRETLQAIARDNRVKAVVIRLNTPGGTVTASDAMYREIRRFRDQTGRPVVAMMMDVAASGGYYVACATDHIVAYPSSITASIGVIIQTVSIKPLMDRWGIKAEAITSGVNKDVGSPLSEMTDEHRVVLKRLVDDFYARFVSLVKERRPQIAAEHLAMVTDGRVLTGNDALKYGLIDQLGELQDALKVAMARANLKRADVVIYHRPLEYVGSAYARTPSIQIQNQVNIATLDWDDALPIKPGEFYYLWMPGQP